jgi:O-glycosyl hydrolase
MSYKFYKGGMGISVLSMLAAMSMPILTSLACAKGEKKEEADSAFRAKIRISLNDERQTIHSFGASDCWSAKYVGAWADVQKKNHIADLLFSTDTTTEGNPKGIGLSLWRFNIGSGSFEQGAASDIPDDWRREECFLNKDGSYDWEKQKGQQWFLNAARQRGVPYTLGFSLTPPTFMSQNGKAYNSSDKPNLNIKPGMTNAYADFLSAVSSHFKFDFLSPVNEPQWFWGKDKVSQEGSQATNTEIAGLVKILSSKLPSKSPETRVVVGEAGQWDFLYGKNTDDRGDQIGQFFSPSSANYIANLPNVKRAISGHSYFTTCPADNMIDIRSQVSSKAKQTDPDLEVWQTEFGILGNICNEYNGGPRNTGINYGLYVAKVIHHDLTIANVTSWQWWLAISPYNYSDALVYINDPSGSVNVAGCKNDGQVLESKQLWVMGNYSRFIRPGMKRIGATADGIGNPFAAAASLMVSAYKDEAQKKIVVVIVNPEQKEKTFELTDATDGLNLAGNILNVYTTTEQNNLKKTVALANNIQIAARSVVTLVGTYR